MKKIAACLLFAIIISTSLIAQTNSKMLRHVVLFGWKAGADSVAINKVIDDFRALPKKIDLIKGFNGALITVLKI